MIPTPAGLLALLALGQMPPGAVSSPDTLTVSQWLIVGPLPIGSREGLVDPIWPQDPASLTPSAGDALPSMMADGGWIHWRSTPGERDKVPFAYDGIDWDALSDQWGGAGLMCAGLAWGTFEVRKPGAYRIEALGIGSLYIDGRRHVGNPYPRGAFTPPVRLSAGRHRVLLRVSSLGPRESHFRLVPAEGPLAVLDSDLTLPDLAASEPLDGFGAAPVVNLTGREVRGAVLRFGGDDLMEESITPIPTLPPEGMLKVPFRVRTRRPPRPGERWHGNIRLELAGIDQTFACSLHVCGAGDPRRMTFLSAQDGSVQKYAVLPPSRGGEGPHALILSLHGAGVEPEGQVRSYSPKDWAYVIAATNTRPWGFDWQDWGRRNVLETLADAMSRFNIDPGRVVLTGHSMGGHGTWHVGTAHADRFAALAPSAGWANFATYVPFTLRRDAAVADPVARGIWERVMAPDNPLPLMGNLRGKPVFVLHGSKDDDVPVFQGRLLSQRAREGGARVTYREVPGMVHWWDRPESPGVDCVDDPEMMAFLRAQRLDSHPREVHLTTADLGTSNRAYWLKIEEAAHPFDRVEADALFHQGTEPEFNISVSGAVAVGIDPLGLAGPGRIQITIEGTRLRTQWRGGMIHLRRGWGGWKIAARAGVPHFLGGLKAAFFNPFVLVYGTEGTDAETTAARRLAVLDSQNWYQRADGFAPVIADTAVTPEVMAGRNLILYGTPGSNAILKRIESRLPIRIDGAGVRLKGRRYDGPGMAARFVYTNPLAPDRLVEIVAGSDIAGLELAGSANPCYSGSGYPDFVVFDTAVRRDGWGGMRAAGFFDARGRVPEDGRDAYLR